MGMLMCKALVFFISATLVPATQAQLTNEASDKQPIIYTIKSGDTLSQLSEKYFRQPANLKFIQNINHLGSIDLLQVGEKLKIPREVVKQSPSQASIISFSCSRPIRAGIPLRTISIGSVLSEGAIIDIPSECHISMLLEDSSVIHLPSSAAVKITTLRKNALESSPEVQLDLVRGRVELEVYKGRSSTTPFDVRTPLSVTGVRGTEFRVGYTPSDETGQVEVLSGVVQAMGVNDAQSRPIEKGQGIPFDRTGKALPIEKLLDAPVFERANVVSNTQTSYALKFSELPTANSYTAISAKSANFLGNRTSQTLPTPTFITQPLSLQAAFYELSAASNSGVTGTPRRYGFCSIQVDDKVIRCKALFEAPLSEGRMIVFSLIKHENEQTQELISTQKLQARNGRFTIEGLPAGHYSWRMSYVMAQDTSSDAAEPFITKQSGSFDLIALASKTP
jgi:hypothetical protein